MRHKPRGIWPDIIAGLFGVFAAVGRVAASDSCLSMPVTEQAATAEIEHRAQDGLAIASVNMAGNPRIGDALASLARDRGFDVLLLQEVGERSSDGSVFVATLGDRLGYHVAYAPADRLGDRETQGLAILSRDPLQDIRTYQLERHHLSFKSRCRIGLAATVATTTGPVRLMNIHLDTRINSRDRIAQLEPLLEAFDGVKGPQIIAGDFNTMNIGWLGTMLPLPYAQQQVSAVRKRLEEDGFNTPFGDNQATFKFLHLPLRLDWIFLKGLAPFDWSVDTLPFTDHRGVSVRVKRTVDSRAH